VGSLRTDSHSLLQDQRPVYPEHPLAEKFLALRYFPFRVFPYELWFGQGLYLILGGWRAPFRSHIRGVAEFLDVLMKESEECLIPQILRWKLHLGGC
jgi:hypothetical protein